MRNIFLGLFLFLSFFANAKYYQGIIKFNDGHEEKGFIKSFLEEKWFAFSVSSSLEKNLNLDDKYMFFKVDKDSEIRKIFIDEINEVVLTNDKNQNVIYRVVMLKQVNKDGTISDKERKVYLPLLREGKINIFGFRFSETEKVDGFLKTEKDEIFYYQNAKEKYAINYGNMDEAYFDILFSGDMRQKILKRMSNPLKDLFKDCPELVNKIESVMQPMIDEEKEALAEDKRMSKEFKKLSKEQKNDLLTIHAYDFYTIEKFIKEYENCK